MSEKAAKQFRALSLLGLVVIPCSCLFNRLQTKTKLFWFIDRLFNSVTSISLIQFRQTG